MDSKSRRAMPVAGQPLLAASAGRINQQKKSTGAPARSRETSGSSVEASKPATRSMSGIKAPVKSHSRTNSADSAGAESSSSNTLAKGKGKAKAAVPVQAKGKAKAAAPIHSRTNSTESAGAQSSSSNTLAKGKGMAKPAVPTQAKGQTRAAVTIHSRTNSTESAGAQSSSSNTLAKGKGRAKAAVPVQSRPNSKQSAGAMAATSVEKRITVAHTRTTSKDSADTQASGSSAIAKGKGQKLIGSSSNHTSTVENSSLPKHTTNPSVALPQFNSPTAEDLASDSRRKSQDLKRANVARAQAEDREKKTKIELEKLKLEVAKYAALRDNNQSARVKTLADLKREQNSRKSDQACQNGETRRLQKELAMTQSAVLDLQGELKRVRQDAVASAHQAKQKLLDQNTKQVEVEKEAVGAQCKAIEYESDVLRLQKLVKQAEMEHGADVRRLQKVAKEAEDERDEAERSRKFAEQSRKFAEKRLEHAEEARNNLATALKTRDEKIDSLREQLAIAIEESHEVIDLREFKADAETKIAQLKIDLEVAEDRATSAEQLSQCPITAPEPEAVLALRTALLEQECETHDLKIMLTQKEAIIQELEEGLKTQAKDGAVSTGAQEVIDEKGASLLEATTMAGEATPFEGEPSKEESGREMLTKEEVAMKELTREEPIKAVEKKESLVQELNMDIQDGTNSVTDTDSSTTTEKEEPSVPDLQLQLLHEQRRATQAEEMVHHLKMECQFMVCSCRLAEAAGQKYVHDDSHAKEMARLEAEMQLAIAGRVENTQPDMVATEPSVPETPAAMGKGSTMSREERLATIEKRRERARTVAQGDRTPKRIAS